MAKKGYPTKPEHIGMKSGAGGKSPSSGTNKVKSAVC